MYSQQVQSYSPYGAYNQQPTQSYSPYGAYNQQPTQNYTPFGMYGQNPHYTLAETPYARMTGQFTPLNGSQIQNLSSFLQPVFVDMNPYLNNTGIPKYPSFIGSQAMMNPNIPLVQPNQIQSYQQQYQNYPPQWAPQQQMYAAQPQQQYAMQSQQQYVAQPQQQYAMQSQQQIYAMQPQQQYAVQPQQSLFDQMTQVFNSAATFFSQQSTSIFM